LFKIIPLLPQGNSKKTAWNILQGVFEEKYKNNCGKNIHNIKRFVKFVADKQSTN